jgi:hypothetical protein
MDILNWPIAKRQGDDCLGLSRELPTIGVHDRGVYQKHSNRVLNDEMDFQMREPSLELSLGGSPPAGLTVALVVSRSGTPTSSPRVKMKRDLVTCRWNVPAWPSRLEIAAKQRKVVCGAGGQTRRRTPHRPKSARKNACGTVSALSAEKA